MAADEAPDLAGFRDAQKRLRQEFGEVVVFLGEVTATFPAGTAVDPETGKPYDPTAEPDSQTQASASALCDIVARPVFGSEEQPSQGGIFETSHLILIADIDDRDLIEDKAHARVREREYLIAATRPDGIAGVQRLLIACREEGT